MKFRYLALSVLAVAVSGAQAKTTTDAEKTIAPFTKKKEDQKVSHAPKPAPLPLPLSTGTRRTSITSKNYIGLELGMTSSVNFGGSDFAVGASYPDGSLRNADLDEYQPGLSFMVNGVVDFALSESFGLQGKVGYRQHKAQGTGTTPENILDPELDNEANFTWDYFGVDVLARIQFAQDGLYGLAGFGFSNMLSNFVNGTQTTTDGSDVTLEFEGEIDDFYNSSRFDFKLGVGTWLPLGEGGTMLAPELMIAIPVTPFYTDETIDNYESFDREVNNMLYASLGLTIKFPWGANSSSDAVAYSGGSASSNSDADRDVEDGRTLLSGRVTDNAGEPIDDATVTVVDLNSNQVVATDETDDGIYNVRVNAPGRYSVTADAPGYLFGSALFEVDNDGRILRHSGDIKLSPSTDGRVRLLVFFDFDKATLQPASYPELNRAVALMKANPNMEVEIAGFTDAQGTDSYNKDLSQRRANTVRDYIVRQGVEASRLSAMGYGEANPVASNDSEEGRAENRRVEFVVKRR